MKSASTRAYAALITVQVCFGLWPTAGAKAMQVMAPAALIGFRTLLGAPILFSLGRLRRTATPTPHDLMWLALLAVFGISANQLLFAEGLLRAGPINGTVISVVIPVMALLVAIALGRERPTVVRILGAVVTLTGVWVLVRAERFELSDRRLVGNLLLLANSSCYATFLVLAKPVVSRLGAMHATGWLFLFGALEALPWTAPAVWATPWSSLAGSVWLSLLFILLAPTVGAYYLNSYALARIDSSVVAVFYGLQPLVGAAAAWWVLGETLTVRTAVAGLLIIGGVLIATLRRRQPAPS